MWLGGGLMAGPSSSRLTRSIRTLVVLAIMIGVPSAAHGQTSSPQTFDETRATVQAFVDAYNRHDINGVLATVAPQPTYWYGDCDYVWHESYGIKGKAPFIRMLRDRFAENDRLQPTQIWEGEDSNGPSPDTLGISGTRTNDPITVQGLPPQDFGAKVIMDPSTGRIGWFMGGNERDCRENDFPRSRPDPVRTRTIAQDFLDAYAAHDAGRIAQLVSSKVTYRDYDYTRCQTETVAGRSALKHWLRQRFGENDQFANTTISLPDESNPDIALLRVTRLSHSISARQLAPQATRIRLVLQRRNENFMGYFYLVARADVTPAAGPASCTSR
jgi:hypothetical protein